MPQTTADLLSSLDNWKRRAQKAEARLWTLEQIYQEALINEANLRSDAEKRAKAAESVVDGGKQ